MTGQIKATAAVVTVEERQQMGIPTTTLRDVGPYYYLPGADATETAAKLREAGFKVADRIEMALDDQEAGERGC